MRSELLELLRSAFLMPLIIILYAIYVSYYVKVPTADLFSLKVTAIMAHVL